MQRIRYALVALASILAFAAVPPLVAQPKLPNPFGKGSKQVDPDASSLDQMNSKDFYEDMKTFAQGLYNKPVGEGDAATDSAFKRKVDTEYEKLRREHQERAYNTNLSAKSEIKYVIEDRFRVFSGLYDNLLVQDLLNRTGQSIIPKKSDHLYTFKLIADPVPRAEALSTGTVYVSTGLVSLLNTKAELAYVLAHEAAHIYRGHYKTQIMLDLATDEYAAKMKANRDAVVRKFTLLGGLIGAGAGAGLGSNVDKTASGAALGALIGGLAGAAVGNLTQPSKPLIVDWNRFEEDEADQTAFEWVLNAKQDVIKIPALYAVLQVASDHDDRMTLGFWGRTDRVRERSKKIGELLEAEKKKPDFAGRVFESSDQEFDLLIAEVKRDNGVLAFHHDMLDVARDNLEKAVAIKTKDPTALYYYAKILQATARNDADRGKAMEYFQQAAENDQRNLNFGADLHRAVALLKPNASAAEQQQATSLLKRYLEDYYLSKMEEHQAQASYPPHLEMVYDYLARAGEFQWVLDGDKVRREAAAKQAVSVPQVDPLKTTPVSTPKPAALPRKP